MLEDLTFGAIIGRARITGIIKPVAMTNTPRENVLGVQRGTVPWHFPEQYGFVVADAKPLATPVPCRGFQGFWRVPAPVLEQLREAA